MGIYLQIFFLFVVSFYKFTNNPRKREQLGGNKWERTPRRPEKKKKEKKKEKEKGKTKEKKRKKKKRKINCSSFFFLFFCFCFFFPFFFSFFSQKNLEAKNLRVLIRKNQKPKTVVVFWQQQQHIVLFLFKLDPTNYKFFADRIVIIISFGGSNTMCHHSINWTLTMSGGGFKIPNGDTLRDPKNTTHRICYP